MNEVLKTERSALSICRLGDLLPSVNIQKLKKAVKEVNYEVDAEIKVCGNVGHQHRGIAFLCNDPNVKGYYYSGQLAKSQKMPEEIEELVNSINKELGTKYNAALCNYYRDGNDYIGEHSDNESNLDPKMGVLSISFGATRIFRSKNIRPVEVEYDENFITCHKTNATTNRYDIELEDEMVCLMSGEYQKDFKHEIPIQKKIKEARVSLTLRYHTE